MLYPIRGPLEVVVDTPSEPLSSGRIWLGLAVTVALMVLLGAWFTGAL